MSRYTNPTYIIGRPRPKRISNFVNVLLFLDLRLRGTITVQRIHPNAALFRHSNSLSSSLRLLKKVSQLLSEDLKTLRRGGVGHAQHRSPKVERVGDVGACAQKDEEDEIDGVAEDC